MLGLNTIPPLDLNTIMFFNENTFDLHTNPPRDFDLHTNPPCDFDLHTIPPRDLPDVDPEPQNVVPQPKNGNPGPVSLFRNRDARQMEISDTYRRLLLHQQNGAGFNFDQLSSLAEKTLSKKE